MPNEKLAPLHFAIEYAVAGKLPGFRQLVDKDIEWIYDQYRTYFQAVRQGKDPAEPDSTRSDRSAVMDYIWEVLLKFENGGGPGEILEEGVMAGHRRVDTADELYVMAFNDLRKSCRLRRKAAGPRGYVTYVREFVAEHLAQEPHLESLYDPSVELGPPPGMVGFKEKRGYELVSAAADYTGIEEVDRYLQETDNCDPLKLRDYHVKHPGNAVLLEELIFALDGKADRQEMIELTEKLIQLQPEVVRHPLAYLNIFVLDEDPAQLREEADRLGFRHDLATYPADADGDYSLLLQHYHATVSTALKVADGDIRYPLELLDDLLEADVPEILLRSSAVIITVGLTKRLHSGDGEQVQAETLALRDEYPLAMDMVGEVMKGEG